MIEGRKDMRDHAYGRARRLIRKVLGTPGTSEKQEAILRQEGIHYQEDYVEFRRYRRYRGFSNHGKCNPKNDRARRVKGTRGIVADKRLKAITRSDRCDADARDITDEETTMQWQEDCKMQTDEWLEDYIKLRRAREAGADIEFDTGWLREFLDEVNSLLWETNVRFGLIRFVDWKYLEMSALVPVEDGGSRVARLTARFDDTSPEYRITVFNPKGKPYIEFTFFRIGGREIGLIPSLRAICKDRLWLTTVGEHEDGPGDDNGQ